MRRAFFFIVAVCLATSSFASIPRASVLELSSVRFDPLPETRIRVSENLAPFERPAPSLLSRALHQSYEQASTTNASGLAGFLSVDPHLDVEAAMKQPQRWNRYAYVSNNPINRIDPDGRQEAAAIEAAMISGDTVEEQAEFWSGYREGLGKGMLAASIFAGGLGARSLLSGGVALYRSFQVSNAMRVAAAGTAALSGSNRDMANQAFSMTARLAGSATQKVQYFQSLAAQITRASSGAWNATKMAGPNGSTVFYGKVGEALVIDSKGNVYRGQLNVAVKVVKDTVEIAWDKLRLVQ